MNTGENKGQKSPRKKPHRKSEVPQVGGPKGRHHAQLRARKQPRRPERALTAEIADAFLAELALWPSITNAVHLVAKRFGMVPPNFSRQLYHHRDNDPDFAQRWHDAKERGLDACEDEAVRRGIIGYEEPLTYQGRKTGQSITRYSDTLLMFYLNGRRSHVFKHRTAVEGADGKPLAVTIYLPSNNRGDEVAPGDKT